MRRTPFVHICLLAAFLFNSIITVPIVQAQGLSLPKPGAMVHLSPSANPPLLKGIKVNPNNPFRFEFILDRGDSVETRHASSLQDESTRLIKYFLASLTIPEKDLWVNLSPYEKDRIVPDSFGVTEMGRDLLAQDYILKQVTASLIYPEDEVGKRFWKRVYEEASKKYGHTNIPINTFNKVWIVPEKAVVYENSKAGTAYVVESRLKVMLEEDYLSMSKHSNDLSSPNALIGDPGMAQPLGSRQKHSGTTNELGSQIVREIVIPELTKEVNEGKNFSQLRQVYNSLILATWYKKKIKDSILSKVYADQSKVQGLSSLPVRQAGPNVLIGDPGLMEPLGSRQKALPAGRQDSGTTKNDVEIIYQQYLQAFKKGVYNYIKEEPVPGTSERIPKKYFSGGFDAALISPSLESAPKNWSPDSSDSNVLVLADLAMVTEDASDKALLGSARQDKLMAQIISRLFSEAEIQKVFEGFRLNVKFYEKMEFPATVLKHRDIIKMIMPFWSSYFQGVLIQNGYDLERFWSELKEGKVSQSVIDKIKLVLNADSMQTSGTFQKFEIIRHMAENFLEERVTQIVKGNKPYQLKLMLAGTLYREVHSVIEMVHAALLKAAQAEGVTDPEEWIRQWNISIVGYSIRTDMLMGIKRLVGKYDAPFQDWVKLEYIDLLDETQWPKMSAEKPDIVFTVNSLYIGEYFGAEHKAERRESNEPEEVARSNQLLAYVRHIYETLPAGGLFVTEVPGAIEPDFAPFLGVSPPKKAMPQDTIYMIRKAMQLEPERVFYRSGLFFKGDSRNYPLSFLGGSENTEFEQRLNQAWQLYVSKDYQKAAEEVVAVFQQAKSAPTPPRFSITSLRMIIDEGIKQPGADHEALIQLKERLQIDQAMIIDRAVRTRIYEITLRINQIFKDFKTAGKTPADKLKELEELKTLFLEDLNVFREKAGYGSGLEDYEAYRNGIKTIVMDSQEDEQVRRAALQILSFGITQLAQLQEDYPINIQFSKWWAKEEDMPRIIDHQKMNRALEIATLIAEMSNDPQIAALMDKTELEAMIKMAEFSNNLEDGGLSTAFMRDLFSLKDNLRGFSNKDLFQMLLDVSEFIENKRLVNDGEEGIYDVFNDGIAVPLRNVLVRDGVFTGWSEKEDIIDLDSSLHGLLLKDIVQIIELTALPREVGQMADYVFHYQDKGFIPDSGFNASLFAPFLAPHFAQLIKQSGLTASEFIERLKQKTLPDEIMLELRSPWTKINTMGGGFDKDGLVRPLFEGYLKEKIRLRANDGSKKLKIVLGGTLFKEIKYVTTTVYETLRALAVQQQIPDVDAWIKGWDVTIVAYSIESTYLREAYDEIKKDKEFPNPQWVHLEYIDLLDDWQMKRMEAEKPDVVLTVCSLYLYEFLSKKHPNTSAATPLMFRYIQQVYDLLGEGGLFAIESDGKIEPPVNNFMTVSNLPTKEVPSGFFVKPTALEFPLAFLGGKNDSYEEKALYQAWESYNSGDLEGAISFLLTGFFTFANGPEYRLRFSKSSVLGILNEYLASPNPARTDYVQSLKTALEGVKVTDAATGMTNLHAQLQLLKPQDKAMRVENQVIARDRAMVTVQQFPSYKPGWLTDLLISKDGITEPINIITSSEEVAGLIQREKRLLRKHAVEKEFILRHQVNDYSGYENPVDIAKRMAEEELNGRVGIDFNKLHNYGRGKGRALYTRYGTLTRGEAPKEGINIKFKGGVINARLASEIQARIVQLIDQNLLPINLTAEYTDKDSGKIVYVGNLLSGYLFDWILREAEVDGIEDDTMFLIKDRRAVKHVELADAAMSATGGVDLTSNEFLHTQSQGEIIKFKIDPAMLQQLQNTPGFYPVIISIQPMSDIRGFLGINAQQTTSAVV